MERKVLTDEQSEIISEQLNIPFTTVKSILKSYRNLLAEEVYLGMEVRLGYILRLVPETTTNNYLATTGYEASVISKQTSIPYNTVLSVITSYLEMIVDSLAKCKNFDVVGLVNLKSYCDDETNEFKVYSSTSRTLIDSLRETGKSVRVKLNINLRDLLKRRVADNGR
ncbi:hypothetical protein COF68_05860 [Bacillus toyonensis]|uniref:hypothetical protein n=1 Tax=Bacillus toyonensis TaxID=155322 RepID=UPI000BFD0484|nr:hypothetical protein [Bacillus toyonensis]PHE64364.1 hypothetical protein COF68_05860 [Bacillus toyonensis]